MSWVFHWKTRHSAPILAHIKRFIQETKPTLNIVCYHFKSDGEAELLALEVLALLHLACLITSHSPRNTPQMNSVTECWVGKLKEQYSMFITTCCYLMASCSLFCILESHSHQDLYEVYVPALKCVWCCA